MKREDLYSLAQNAGVPTEVADYFAPYVALLDELLTRHLSELSVKTPVPPVPFQRGIAGVAEHKVRGVDPHALVSVEIVAERWGMQPDTVRKIDRAALPRVVWRGSGIRYRGADVLRYEGVGEEEIGCGAPASGAVPPNVVSIEARKGAPEQPPSRWPGRPSKAGRLPQT